MALVARRHLAARYAVEQCRARNRAARATGLFQTRTLRRRYLLPRTQTALLHLLAGSQARRRHVLAWIRSWQLHVLRALQVLA